ncbi:MAG: TIGR03773 family transporter-associated surface protein [Cellulomonadaceae bacterium]
MSFDASFVDNDELSSLTVKFDVAPLQADSSDSYLTTFQADSSGRLQATNGSNWDTRKEGYKGTIQQDAGSGYFNWGGDVATSQTEGLAFSEPGRYCVTMRSQVTLADTEEPTEAYATYTFAVGVDPENVEQCEQVDGGVVDPNSGDEDELLPDVNYLEKGHVDIGPTFESDDLRINAFYDIGGGEHEEMSLDDTIFVLKSQFGKHTATARESFFAEEGSDYWLFPQDGSIQHSLLWPGWSSAHLGVPAERGVKFRLLGVDGPEGGEAAVYSDSALQGSPAGVYFGTTTGLPGTREVRASHVHSNWAFTQPGVYCLTIESSVRGVEGDGVVSIAQEQLTVAVGDVSLTGVQPCSRVQDPVVAELPPLDADSIDDTPYSLSSDQALITPFVGEDGRIDAFARTQGDLAQDRILRDVESVVFTAPRQAGSQWMGAATGEVQWDGTYLDQDAIIEMGEVDGPGRFRDYTSWHTFDSADSDLGPGTLWQGRQHPTGYRLYAPGVYCVPWTFSVDGESVTKTLTYFAGDGDPASVELCADGGEATDPGEDPGNGEDPEEDIEWEVPNGSNTKSGARIINDGHVDVASVLSGRTLDTKIKDDTTGTGSPDYLDPEKTVLQVTPFAQTTVTSAAQGFIADVGDTVWQVNETPQDGLLWPGWSTERVPLNATTNGVNWKLNAVDGPGEVAVFANGAERVYFNTKDGITAADQFEIPKNTHTHANWTFTAEGVYCMAWERSTTLTNGNRVMDSFVTAFAVGEVNVRDIDPAKCFTEPAGKPGDDERGQSPTNLTDGNAGEVQVLGGENGFTSGQLVTVQVGREYVGEWVSMWIGTEWMGWAYVGESGAAQARIPVGVQPGGHRLAVMDRDGALIGWDSLNIVRAKTPGSGGTPAPDGRPAAQQVAAEQCVAGATILSAGHIDYSSRIVGGKLESLIGDDTSGTKVYREPSGTILWLKPESRKGGVWQVPQTQNPNLIWLGWSTEALHRGNARGSVQWTIDSISGPGTLTVYTSGVFGGVQETVFANGGSKSIGLGVHAHANWDFSAEGIYRITSTQTITLANGQRSSDTETLTIAVGNVDPASAAAETGGSGCGVVSNAMLLDDEDADKAAQAAAQAKAEAAKAARDRLPGGESGTLGITNPFTALTDGDPVPLLLSILASLLSAGAVGSGVMWWRRRQLSLL